MQDYQDCYDGSGEEEEAGNKTKREKIKALKEQTMKVDAQKYVETMVLAVDKMDSSRSRRRQTDSRTGSKKQRRGRELLGLEARR